MSKFKIILVPFPFTNLSSNKIRPAIVLSDRKKSKDIICAFISSLKRPRVGHFDLVVLPTVKNGLKTTSIMKLDKLATLEKKIILGEIGELEVNYQNQINYKLKRLFDL